MPIWKRTNYARATAYRVERVKRNGRHITLGVHSSKALADSIARREANSLVIPVRRNT